MRPIDFVEKHFLRKKVPEFRVGDTVEVHIKTKEAERERIHVFEGIVIAKKGGGLSETFTVRKLVQGVGVERIFPLQSPIIAKVVVKKRGRVRRAKLYYLRKKVGREARVEQIFAKREPEEEKK
jgi:large subunit ribosomal protein L19